MVSAPDPAGAFSAPLPAHMLHFDVYLGLQRNMRRVRPERIEQALDGLADAAFAMLQSHHFGVIASDLLSDHDARLAIRSPLSEHRELIRPDATEDDLNSLAAAVVDHFNAAGLHIARRRNRSHAGSWPESWSLQRHYHGCETGRQIRRSFHSMEGGRNALRAGRMRFWP